MEVLPICVGKKVPPYSPLGKDCNVTLLLKSMNVEWEALSNIYIFKKV